MLKIFGVPLSQPCRAVIWVCLYKGLPFEIVLVNPGSKSAKGSRHPNFLAMNPQGTIPTIKDDDGHVLWESNAILTYLAQKHGWTDLYPADLRRRSLVDQYLHWHHRNAREASLRLAAPNFRKDIKFPPGYLEQGKATVLRALRVFEEMLSRNAFVSGPTLSLADFAAYMEVNPFGQLAPRFGNLVDFGPYPKTSAWMAAMARVPHFAAANKANEIIGDLTAGVSKKTIIQANKQSLVAVQRVQRSSKL